MTDNKKWDCYCMYYDYDPDPRGLRSKVPGIIDDHCNYSFDPAYIIDKEGNIRITEISLIVNPTKEV